MAALGQMFFLVSADRTLGGGMPVTYTNYSTQLLKDSSISVTAFSVPVHSY